jgi:hypothetical protein
MRKLYFLFALLFVGGIANAQLYSEDFESYTVGSYMGINNPTWWSTWSNAPGGSEDVQVSNLAASSGSNSLYLNAPGTGGPVDAILKFGQQYTSGIFTFEADFFVKTGKNGYFNFQGTQTPGQQWALDVNMDAGVISMGSSASSAFPMAQWFTLKIEANLTLGLWEFWIDGISQGTWNNPNNQVASMDLFPIQNSSYYIDDISFDHTTYTLPNRNAGISGVNMVGNVVGQTVNPQVNLTNVGVTNITSFDISLTYNGATITENVTGVNIASLAPYEVAFSSTMNLVAGPLPAVAIVSNVNGMGADDDPNDDTLTLSVNPVTPAPGKFVVGEEATGTWCQWCPRGAVYMDLWNERYAGYFAPIAVHNGDPMTDAVYDTGIGALIGGYPSSLVDRGSDIDPSSMENQIITRLQTTPSATILNGADWNSTTRELKVSLQTTFQSAVSGDYRMACVLTEDGVTGTGSGYNQSNAYAGGGNGPMGGYENLPASVPASQMVYEYVARSIVPQFDGAPGSLPASITGGAQFIHNYTFQLDPTWDDANMHIVGLLIGPGGTIENAGFTTIAEAVTNGHLVGVDEGIGQLLDAPDAMVKLYPNPATDRAVALLDLAGDADVSIKIIDMTGKEVAMRDYGTLNGPQQFDLNTSAFATGIYFVQVRFGENIVTKKLVIK